MKRNEHSVSREQSASKENNVLNEHCAWVQRQLPLYLDGELNPEQEQVVAEHVGGCPSCGAALVDAQELVFSTVSALVEAEPAADLTARITKQIRRERPRSRPWVVWINSVAALFLLAVGILFWNLQSQFESNQGAQVDVSRSILDPAPEKATKLVDQQASAPPVNPSLVEFVSNTQSPAPATTPPTWSSESSRLMVLGDINADGAFTVSDLKLMIVALQNGLEAVPCPAAADFDGDEQLTLSDSVLAGQTLSLNDGAPSPRSFVEFAQGGSLACSIIACP